MEMAGPDAPARGRRRLGRELESPAFSGEVIVAGVLGAMAAEYHPTGGLATDRPWRMGPMVGEVAPASIRASRRRPPLDPAQQAFLNDHRIDGTPVLPGVMGMESFAEVASLVAPQRLSGGGVETSARCAPCKFFRDEPRTLTISAVVSPTPEGGDLLARVHPDRQPPVARTGRTDDLDALHGDGPLTQADPEPGQAEVTTEATAGGALDQGPSTPSTSTARPTRSWTRRGGTATGDRADVGTPAGQPRPRGRTAHHGAAAGRVVLPDRGPVGGRDRCRLALPMRVGRTSVLRDPSTVDGPLYARATPRAGGFDARHGRHRFGGRAARRLPDGAAARRPQRGMSAPRRWPGLRSICRPGPRGARPVPTTL